MNRRKGVIFVLGLLLVFAVMESSWATMANFKSFRETYPERNPKASSCKVCHLSAMGKGQELNVYGESLVEFKGGDPEEAENLVEEDYRAIEEDDSDGDGATNLQELEADTNPGDPESHPESLGD